MNNNEFKKSKNGQYTVYTLESATGGSTSAGNVGSVSKPMGSVHRRGDNLITQEGDKDQVDASKPRNFVAKNAKMGGAGAHKDKKKEQKQGNVKHKNKDMDMAEGEKTMSRAAKGHEKYGKAGMQALAKAGRDGASEKKLDTIRNRYDTYNEDSDPCWKDYKQIGMKKKGSRSVPNCVPKEGVGEDHEVSMASNELKSIHSDAQKLLGLVQQYGENGDLQAWQQSKITKAADYLNSVLQSIGGEQGVAEGLEDKVVFQGHTIGHIETDSDGDPVGIVYSNNPQSKRPFEIFGYEDVNQLKREMISQWNKRVPKGVAEGPGFDKWADDRAASQLHKLKPGMVQDRKTGKWYDPNKEFDKKMNSPEVMAQMKRMAQKEGVAEGLSKRDQQDVAAIRAAIARLESQLNHPNADKAAIQQSIAHEKKRLALYGVTEAVYNPDTFVGKKGTYKGYGITQEGPYQWGISSSARKFPTLNAAKRHIDKNLVAEGGIGDKIKGAVKSVKRASQGWGAGGESDAVSPKDVVQAFGKMDGQRLANFVASRKDLSKPRNNSARAFADKVIDREMRQRGYGRVAGKDEQGVAEGSDKFSVSVKKDKSTYPELIIAVITNNHTGEQKVIAGDPRKLRQHLKHEFGIDYNFGEQGVAEGQTPEQEIERLKLRQNAEHGKAPLRRQAATQARIRELEKQIKDDQGVSEGPELKKAKREYNQAAKDAGGDWAGAGKKIDNMKKGLRQKDVGKDKSVAETDGYMEGLMQKLAEKIPASAPVDVWVQDFQKADPNKYHQFKNKTPAKKAQMAVAASYAAKNPDKKK